VRRGTVVVVGNAGFRPDSGVASATAFFWIFSGKIPGHLTRYHMVLLDGYRLARGMITANLANQTGSALHGQHQNEEGSKPVSF
jgi:hypothetical protein